MGFLLNLPAFFPAPLDPNQSGSTTNNTGAEADCHLAFYFDNDDSFHGAFHGLTLYMFAPKVEDFDGNVFRDAYVANQPGIAGHHAAVYQFSFMMKCELGLEDPDPNGPAAAH